MGVEMKNFNKNVLKRVLLALLFLIFLLISPSFSLMIKLPLIQLVQTADVIILGDVENIRCEWSLNKKIILTITTLRIKEVWKGNVRDSRIIIQTLGGTIGDLSLNVSDVSVYQKGEEVLVFLKTIDDVKHLENSFSVSLNFLPSFSVFGRAQGKYSIDKNKIARKGEYSLLDKEVDTDNVITLPELEVRIKLIVKDDLRTRQKKHETIK
ncbi:MAG: hypothetical protein KJ727_13240 [Acidobacteria bacterium]|nr:hypothetical protein [Acidobacteriota bacterium]